MKSIFTFFFLLCFTLTVLAQPGTIDKTYGSDQSGTVLIQDHMSVTTSAIQPDNKLIVGIAGSAATQYALARHNKDGSVDLSFGNEGEIVITTNDLMENTIYNGGFTSVVSQSDGNILAVGNITNNTFDGSILIAKLSSDGTPDENFGSHGRVLTHLDYTTVATQIAVQTDGKILVCGYQYKDIFNVRGDVLLRYNPDGTLDKTFGKYNGYTNYDETGGSRYYALMVQPDGKILAGGTTNGGSKNFLLVRFLPDGAIDNSFGKNGAATTSFTPVNGGTNINSFALDEKNRIAAEGSIGGNEKVGVARYLIDGAPDNSFDEDGKLELSFNSFSYSYVTGNKIFSQMDGKLIIHSLIAGTNDVLFRTALSGLNEDGSIDVSYGTDKGQTIFNSQYADDISSDAAMQTDGKIIISGNTQDDKFNQNGYALTRFMGYPTKVPLSIRIKRWLQNHTISWKGLPADDKVAFYTVEQSDNSTSGFRTIGKVSSLSNLRDYSITNTHLLPGSNYYRIKAISTDDVVRFSEVVSADNTSNTASLYPNPARSYITVQGLKTTETVNISINDGTGNVFTEGVSQGSTKYRSILGSNMQPGTYYLNINSGSKTKVLKFVKQ